MHFAYEGFTQDGDIRCFLFRHLGEHQPISIFAIEIDLRLFMQNGMPVQEGPMFCLQLLNAASVTGPTCLDGFRSYKVVRQDFHSFVMERERVAAEKAARKLTRKPFRPLPSMASNL